MIGLITSVLIAVTIGAAVFGNWHNFVDFLRNVYRAAVNVISKTFAGVKCFLKKVWGSITEIVKEYFYDKERDKWTERTTERDIPPDRVADEVPADIRAKVEREMNREHDVTEKVELKLKECA